MYGVCEPMSGAMRAITLIITILTATAVSARVLCSSWRWWRGGGGAKAVACLNICPTQLLRFPHTLPHLLCSTKSH